jgi:GxxExxY protein
MEGTLLLKEETEGILGGSFEVLNILGHGLWEKPYENALCVEFKLRGIPFEQQPRFDVIYKAINVGLYMPDIIAFGKVVVDTKVIERIGDHEVGQMIHYLRRTQNPCRLDHQFQARQARMEKDHSLTQLN